MLTIAYASRALISARSPDMLEVLRACMRNNARLGVTGALYYDGRQFYQVLEGDDTVIACLYDTIRNDPRHTDVQLLLRQPITQRRFDGWSMKFVDGSGRTDLQSDFEYPEATHPELHAQDPRLEALLVA